MTNCDEKVLEGMKFGCLLFDLDGTLVDSRADLVTGVNLMLRELGEPELTAAAVIGFVGEGARLLVERSLRASRGRDPEEGEIETALGLFVRHYREHLLDQTTLYPGVREALDELAGLPLAVVTNKPVELAVAMIDGLGLRGRFRVVLGGDSLPERKPSPLMLLEAARICGVAPAETFMIGDSRIDIAAGRAAGMQTGGFTSGFRGVEELRTAGADLLFDHFAALPGLLRRG
jgi:phosphoglycolate phosphatase